MKSKVIEDNWPKRVIRITTGEKIELTANDPDDCSRVLATNASSQEIGEIWFSREEYNHRGNEVLLITALGLDKLGESYTRQGIGEAILGMVKDHNELPIVARCPLGSLEKPDGSHLTGIGPNFVIKMRELGLIEKGCYDEWCMCQPDSSSDCEETYP
jgi:hypothetical protein